MRILSSIHPSATQKQVIALILAAATPKLAAESLAGSQNLIAARNMLMKLGIINFAAGEASLTDAGMRIATEENIADEMGELTDAGRALVPGAAPAPQQPAAAPPAPGGELPPLESTYPAGSLLREVYAKSFLI